MAADRFDLFRDAAGVTPLGTLEGHVLEQVRNAMYIRGFLASSRIDPNADGRRLKFRHAIGDNAQTVVESGYLNRHE
jgi:hypothetical protein